MRKATRASGTERSAPPVGRRCCRKETLGKRRSRPVIPGAGVVDQAFLTVFGSHPPRALCSAGPPPRGSVGRRRNQWSRGRSQCYPVVVGMHGRIKCATRGTDDWLGRLRRHGAGPSQRWRAIATRGGGGGPAAAEKGAEAIRLRWHAPFGCRASRSSAASRARECPSAPDANHRGGTVHRVRGTNRSRWAREGEA
jgi:hypothetical protein